MSENLIKNVTEEINEIVDRMDEYLNQYSLTLKYGTPSNNLLKIADARNKMKSALNLLKN